MSENDGDVLAEVDQLIQALESHPDATVRAQVIALLEGIDAVHRTALTHLMTAIHGMAGEAFVNRLTADPAIRLLLMSYDLIAVDRRLVAEEALDTVRGHLHGHGIDVELVEVVGGVVYVRLHGLERSRMPVEGVRHDLEEALQAGLLGFQELELGDRRSSSAPANVVQLSGLRRAHRPVYRRALATSDVLEGQVTGVQLEGLPVLIANVEGEYYAVSNRCGDSPLPLEFSELHGSELRCSWHGCRYDIRSGKRLDGMGDESGEGERLSIFPVAIENGEILVAVGVEPAGDGARPTDVPAREPADRR